MKCKFNKICGKYQGEAVTCNSYDAEDGYCGIYRYYKSLEEGKDE